jgi:hypothetical protein
MSDAKSNAFEERLVQLIFLGSSFATLFENDQSSPATALSVQLHTADPGETGDCTTSEATYGAYARIGVARAASGWTITTPNTVKPTTNITFPQCTSGTNTITHFSIGLSTVAASTSTRLYHGAVTPNISVSAGVTPRLTTATAITEN